MRKLKRMWRSFHKNIIVKRKFRSYWMSLVDLEYRSQIKYIFDITKETTQSKIAFVPINLLVHGHKIVYHEYAAALMVDDEVNLEPIKVFYHKGMYVVIDGNHRLPAIKSRSERLGLEKIKAEVIF